ncbi:MAG: hypothetical protein KBA28_13015, partial [Syntrophaceae bacterium]|nr:hypothetical protein [Syntrophaceae bacterium]
MQSSSRKTTSVKIMPDSRPLRMLCHNQKGGLLIGLIIIMVIASLLGAGMVYIISNTSLNSISSNFSKRAYYNAESGIRYLIALYRNADSPDDGRLALQGYQNSTTVNMPSGGSVVLQVNGLSGTFTPATANYSSHSGSSLTLTITSGTFPTTIGFFKKDGTETIYRYTGSSLSGSTLTLTGVYPSITTSGGAFSTVEKAKIIAKGKFGGGIWSRQVTYEWPLSGSKYGGMASGSPYAPDNKDVTKFKYSDFNISASKSVAAFVNFWLDIIAWFTGKSAAHLTGVDIMRWYFEEHCRDWFGTKLCPTALVMPNSGCGAYVQSWGTYEWDEGESAIKANSSTSWWGGHGGFFLPYNYDFKAERTLGRGRLNYDAQTKMKIEGWNKNNYLVGLSVRADSRCWASGWDPVVMNQYGISYARGNNYMFNLPNDRDPFLVFWRSIGNDFKLLAYKKLNFNDGVLEGMSFFDDMETSPNGWTVDTTGHSSTEWTTSQYHSSSHSRRLKGRYQSGDGLVNNYAFMWRNVNFAGASTATISFWYKKGSEWDSRSGWSVNILEVGYYNSSGTWSRLDSFTPTDSWQKATVQMTSGLGSSTKLGISANTTIGTTDVYIDDVDIVAYRLKDWPTLGVRVREKGTSGSMSNEFEIFYGDQ